jgi:hypothetical protein
MWTIRDGETPRAKFERMAEVKARILELKERIPEIASLQVYFNSPSASEGNSDVVLDSTFNSWGDLDVYLKHPDHLLVADYIANVRQSRAAIDYEF